MRNPATNKQTNPDENNLVDRGIMKVFRQHTVSHFLLVVRYDTADEVRIGVVEGLHEASQLFLVGLSDRAKHPLSSCPSAESCRRVARRRHRGTHAHDLRWQSTVAHESAFQPINQSINL